MDKFNEFFNYIQTPVSKESILMIFNDEGVVHQRLVLYGDFVLSLLKYCFDTYMGDDITSEVQQLNHFDWCFRKTVENFKSENINLGDLKELKEYYKDFLVEVYYSMPDKESSKEKIDNIVLFWKQLFDYNTSKTKADVDCLLSVYRLFEKSINNKQKIKA